MKVRMSHRPVILNPYAIRLELHPVKDRLIWKIQRAWYELKGLLLLAGFFLCMAVLHASVFKIITRIP